MLVPCEQVACGAHVPSSSGGACVSLRNKKRSAPAINCAVSQQAGPLRGLHAPLLVGHHPARHTQQCAHFGPAPNGAPGLWSSARNGSAVACACSSKSSNRDCRGSRGSSRAQTAASGGAPARRPQRSQYTTNRVQQQSGCITVHNENWLKALRGSRW